MGEGDTGEEGEGARQKTRIEDSLAWTMGWGLTVGLEGGVSRAGESNGEKDGTTVIEQQ